MSDILINSPGRGGTGRMRNFKAMNITKLDGVISDLVRYGQDDEALAAAKEARARLDPEADDDREVPSVEQPKEERRAVAPAPAPSSGDHDSEDLQAQVNPIPLHPSKIPMKGKAADGLAADPSGWVMEPKLDGHRALVYIGEDGAKLYAGSGVDKTHLVPHIVEHIFSFAPTGTWVDGEVVVGDGLASVDWGGVQSILGSGSKHPKHKEASFVAFDLLAYDGHDMRGLALSDRREILEKMSVGNTGTIFRVNEQWDVTEEGYNGLIEQGYEGVMLKRLASRYQCARRSPDWIKVKVTHTEDAVIMGFEPGKASFAGLIGAIVFGQYVDGVLTERGKCSGMDMATRKAISADEQGHIGKVIEFAYMGRMPSGSYRHPQFKRFRPDKDASECIDQGGK